MPTFSLRALLGLTTFCAVAAVSLLNPLPWVYSLWSAATLLVLLFSILGAIYETGARRAAWIGFALFAWTHAGVLRQSISFTGSFVPPFSREAGHWIADNLMDEKRLLPYREEIEPGRYGPGRNGFSRAFRNMAAILVTLPFGLLGAWGAVRFYRRREAALAEQMASA